MILRLLWAKDRHRIQLKEREVTYAIRELGRLDSLGDLETRHRRYRPVHRPG